MSKPTTSKHVTVNTPTVMPKRPGPVLIGDPAHPSSKPAAVPASIQADPLPASDAGDKPTAAKNTSKG